MNSSSLIDSAGSVRLHEQFSRVRSLTEELAAPLSSEDCAVQSMPDVSPTKWHLAHTTWFFETFVLSKLDKYSPYDDSFGYLFNSYYNTVGQQFPRPNRGLLSRPSLDAVFDYRQHVDQQIADLLADGTSRQQDAVIELGLHHEQQHQELLLTDIKHVLAQNPLYPVYREGKFATSATSSRPEWLEFDEGIEWIGHNGSGFAYDNESPRHREFVESFQISDQLVTCGEYLEFIEDGGYKRPELWLSIGWNQVQERGWQAPLYWFQREEAWREFTLAGARLLDLSLPVCHVSYFEADAFARWSGKRLPTEVEWEVAAESSLGHPASGVFVDTCLNSGHAIHPAAPQVRSHDLPAFLGKAWQWTASPYVAYPGYEAPEGALGEYNGKFMCNQFVLRGGSCATSSSHIRTTYRNFFPPEARWQFTGIRLCS